MRQDIFDIGADAEMLPGAPKFQADLIRRAFAREDDGEIITDSVRTPGSQAYHHYQCLGRLYFDPSMRRFWLTLRKAKLTENYLHDENERVDSMIESADTYYLEAEGDRTLLSEKPIEYALEQTAGIIVQISKPKHPYFNKSRQDIKQNIDKIVSKANSLSQALSLNPYFDIPVIQMLDFEFIKKNIKGELRRHERAFIASYNPPLHKKLSQVLATSDGLDSGAYNEAIEIVAKLEDSETEIGIDEHDNLNEAIASSVAENSRRYAWRNVSHNQTAGKTQRLSELLRKFAAELDDYRGHGLEDPASPRPQAKNADVIAFCRKLDAWLNYVFKIRSPTAIACCASTLFDTDVSSDNVKRWRASTAGGNVS